MTLAADVDIEQTVDLNFLGGFSLNEQQLVQIIAGVCLEEKARDILILDVSELTIIAEYFIIASGRTAIHVKAIADAVEMKLKEAGIMPLRKDGMAQGVWAVLDYGSVLVHLFRQEERDYYGLENLWGDAREVLVKDEAEPLV